MALSLFFSFRTTEKGLLLSLDRLQKGLKARSESSNNNKCSNNNNNSSCLFNSNNFSISSNFNNNSSNNNNSLRNSNHCNCLSISKGILHLPHHHPHHLLLLHLRNNGKNPMLKYRKKSSKSKKIILRSDCSLKFILISAIFAYRVLRFQIFFKLFCSVCVMKIILCKFTKVLCNLILFLMFTVTYRVFYWLQSNLNVKILITFPFFSFITSFICFFIF